MTLESNAGCRRTKQKYFFNSRFFNLEFYARSKYWSSARVESSIAFLYEQELEYFLLTLENIHQQFFFFKWDSDVAILKEETNEGKFYHSSWAVHLGSPNQYRGPRSSIGNVKIQMRKSYAREAQEHFSDRCILGKSQPKTSPEEDVTIKKSL